MAQHYRWFRALLAGGASLGAIPLLERALTSLHGSGLLADGVIWTSITVAVCGGLRFGQKRASWSGTGFLVTAGCWLMLLPLFGFLVYDLAAAAGHTAGIAAVALVFFVPLYFLQGIVCALMFRDEERAGSGAAEAAGKIIIPFASGGLLTAGLVVLFLLPSAGATISLFILGGLEIAAGALFSFATGRRTAGGALLMFLAAAGTGIVTAGPPQRSIPHISIVHSIETAAHDIRVADSPYGRHLIIDGRIRSRTDTATWKSDMPHHGVLETGKYFFRTPGSVLLIGVGDAALAKSFFFDGWDVTAVEPERELLAVTKSFYSLEYFKGDVRICEPGEFLRANTRKFDVVMVEGTRFLPTPATYLTREFASLAKEAIGANGIFAIQIEAESWNDVIAASIYRTLGRVFRNVILLPMAEPPDQFGSVVFFASDRPLEPVRELEREVFLPEYRMSLSYHRNHAWDNQFVPDTLQAPVLTADRNPSALWMERLMIDERSATSDYFLQTRMLW